LDVDGVLNPFALPRGALPPGFAEYTIDGFELRLTRRHGDWLSPFINRFQFVWATTWEAKANGLIAPLVGVPANLPVVTFGAVERRGDWKLPAVAAFAGSLPVAWIDDDLGSAAEDWARTRGAPTLLLRADPTIGLARRHIDALQRFADRLELARSPDY
jgi:hypothetical protein